MIRAIPLTAEAFRAFGDVVSCEQPGGADMNQGTALRFDWCATLTNARGAAAKLNVVAARVVAQSLPYSLRVIERHPHSTQTFIPMKCSRYLVCMAPTLPDGKPNLAELQAFICLPGQAVNYPAGAWHSPIVALDAPAEFTMLVHEDGSSGDCEAISLASPLTITAP